MNSGKVSGNIVRLSRTSNSNLTITTQGKERAKVQSLMDTEIKNLENRIKGEELKSNDE